MRPIPLLTLVLLLAALPVRAEWRDIPYADVAKMPLALKAADPQGIYTAFYRAVPAKDKATLPPGLEFQVRAGQQLVPVPVQADGRVDFPIRQEWADNGASIQVNQPKGSFGMSFSMTPRTPAGTAMTYGQLTESVPVLERGIKQMAGLMSFLAPKVRAIQLTFASAPQTVVVSLAGGQKKLWKSDAAGKIRLPWEPSWSAASVTLSAPLKEIEPVMK